MDDAVTGVERGLVGMSEWAMQEPGGSFKGIPISLLGPRLTMKLCTVNPDRSSGSHEAHLARVFPSELD